MKFGKNHGTGGGIFLQCERTVNRVSIWMVIRYTSEQTEEEIHRSGENRRTEAPWTSIILKM